MEQQLVVQVAIHMTAAENIGDARQPGHHLLLGPLQNMADSGRYGAPTGLLCSEALASGGSDLVEARPALVFGSHPSRFDPAGLFHAMEGGIERTFFDAQDVLGHGLNPGGDAVAVKRSTPGKNLQREEGERALQGILTGHT